ncbi:hypothetical protein BX600DRAFT_198192 [Xylariales sp. PMI_506]|nr:hypothetical protein BX600DRAFT_198192 [Xylariales sp. PMI_506]
MSEWERVQEGVFPCPLMALFLLLFSLPFRGESREMGVSRYCAGKHLRCLPRTLVLSLRILIHPRVRDVNFYFVQVDCVSRRPIRLVKSLVRCCIPDRTLFLKLLCLPDSGSRRIGSGCHVILAKVGRHDSAVTPEILTI